MLVIMICLWLGGPWLALGVQLAGAALGLFLILWNKNKKSFCKYEKQT